MHSLLISTSVEETYRDMMWAVRAKPFCRAAETCHDRRPSVIVR
jgi:hypothetical protein